MKFKKEDSSIHILTGTLGLIDNIAPPESAAFTELDLGCGKGGFACMLAQKYPERSVIAADVMIGRLRKLVNKTKNAGITNIKLLRTEARALVCLSLPHKSIDRVHILCPDPWPKHKHKGERLMSSEFIYRLSLVLKDNGVLHFSTDDTRYFKATCDLVGMTDFFAPDSAAAADVADMKTDFEKKWNQLGLEVSKAAWRKVKNV